MTSQISAIIPNYNHANYLPTSVKALQQQTRPPDEIIIIDDASTDNSIEVISALVGADPRIKFLKNPKNRGAIFTLNRGIEAASGNFIYCGAADDVTEKNLLATLLAQLGHAPEAGFACGVARLTNQTSDYVSLRPAIIPSVRPKIFTSPQTRDLLRVADNLFLSVVTLYRTQNLREMGGFDETLGPYCDGYALREIAAKNGFVFVPKILGTWRQSNESYSQALLGQPAENLQFIEACCIKAENNPHFNDGFAKQLRCRLVFSTVRKLIHLQNGAPQSFLKNAGFNGSYVNLMYWVEFFPPKTKEAFLLVLATLLLRPFSLRKLALSWVLKTVRYIK